jgi:hypothetical protein
MSVHAIHKHTPTHTHTHTHVRRYRDAIEELKQVLFLVPAEAAVHVLMGKVCVCVCVFSDVWLVSCM